MFNETMDVGAGNIFLTSLTNPSSSRTIAVNSDKVTIEGPMVFIDFEPEFSAGRYTLEMERGVLTDRSTLANPFVGLTSRAYFFDVADVRGPTLVSYNPLIGAIGVRNNTRILLTFDKVVVAGHGYIMLTPEGGTGRQVTINVASTAQVQFNGTVVTIIPSSLSPVLDLPVGSAIAPETLKDQWLTCCWTRCMGCLRARLGGRP